MNCPDKSGQEKLCAENRLSLRRGRDSNPRTRFLGSHDFQSCPLSQTRTPLRRKQQTKKLKEQILYIENYFLARASLKTSASRLIPSSISVSFGLE